MFAFPGDSRDLWGHDIWLSLAQFHLRWLACNQCIQANHISLPFLRLFNAWHVGWNVLKTTLYRIKNCAQQPLHACSNHSRQLDYVHKAPSTSAVFFRSLLFYLVLFLVIEAFTCFKKATFLVLTKIIFKILHIVSFKKCMSFPLAFKNSSSLFNSFWSTR